MLESVLGLAIALVGMLGGIIARDRQIMKMIADGDQKNANDLKLAENNLHERINKTNQDINIRFREDSESNRFHFVEKAHFESCVDSLRDEMKSMNKKLDLLLGKHLQ